MTTQPVDAALGACFLVPSDPIANNAMSQPEKSNVSKSFVIRVLSPKLTSVPKDRRLARTAISVSYTHLTLPTKRIV